MSRATLSDNWVKGVLALSWSLFVMLAVGYIIVVHGKEKEILTLLIGFITGAISAIFGVYFASNLINKHSPPVGATADVTMTVNDVPLDTGPEIKKE